MTSMKMISAPRRSNRLARIITEVFAPSPLAAVVLIVVAWRYSPTTGEALKWSLLGILFAPVVPLLYLLRQLRRGKVTDHHVRRREQRAGIILFTLACGFAALVVLLKLGAPSQIIGLICAGAAGLIIALAITHYWKISIHTGVTAGIVVVFLELFGWWMLLLVPLVALVGWARVAVDDHTPAQVTVGAFIGAFVSGITFALVIAALR
ncbi:MAG: phosphatase PAP2 family protein [Burkholderiaceae bacterium]